MIFLNSITFNIISTTGLALKSGYGSKKPSLALKTGSEEPASLKRICMAAENQTGSRECSKGLMTLNTDCCCEEAQYSSEAAAVFKVCDSQMANVYWNVEFKCSNPGQGRHIFLAFSANSNVDSDIHL